MRKKKFWQIKRSENAVEGCKRKKIEKPKGKQSKNSKLKQQTKQKGNNKMNNKKTSKFAIRRAKETKLGRILSRLAGEENGAVMMEYVIVAVMIAAAVAIAAWLFGAQIMGMFGVAGDEMIGKHDTAVANQQALRDAKPGQNEAAVTAGKTYQEADDAENRVNPGN